MAILLVTYDLRQPGRNYVPVHDFLKKFTYCKGLESVWLLDTTQTVDQVRDALMALIDKNDVALVCRIYPRTWASYNYGCADWLKDSRRNW